MLYNGERIGDGSPPEVDIAVDPLEGTTLTARGHALGARGDRAVGAGHDVRPGPLRLHGEDRRRPRGRRPASASTSRSSDVIRKVAERKGGERRRRHRDHARPPPPRGGGRRRSARSARGIRFITDGDVVGRAVRRHAEGTGVDLLWGIGGTPEGVLSAAAIKCLGGQHPRPALAPRRRRAQGRGRRRLRPRRGARRRPTWSAGNDVFFAATGVTDGDLLQGVRYLGRRPRDDRVAGDALALGHRAHGAGAPRPAEAARGHRRPLRLAAPEPLSATGGRRRARPCRAARSAAR